jgi:hypothetical protein
MSVYYSILISIFISVLSFAQTEATAEYKDHECYIQFEFGINLGNKTSQGNFSELHNYPELYEMVQNGVITRIETSFKTLASMEEEFTRIYTLTIANSSNLQSTLESLNKLDYINFAEKIPVYRHSLTPNDPMYSNASNRWYLDSIGAELAWDITTGCNNVKIAIVDDAVLTSHEDLASSIYTNSNEIAGNGIDDDGNGYIDDVNGWDAADNDNNANPPSSASNSFFTHGTHVAGIAGASSNNSIGIASMGFNSSIIPVKTKSNTNVNPGVLDNPMLGVEYAIAAGADVINMSWGGYGSSNAHQLVFNLAYSNGIVCIGATGNDGLSFIAYPANYNHVIAVAASGTDNDFAPFTNFSQDIDVFAPGVDIYSTLAGGTSEYGVFSGTSMATPIVSGLAALMICNDPSMSPNDIQNCMVNSATMLPTQHNPSYLIPLINPSQALSCLPSVTLSCVPSGCELIANGDFETPANSNISMYGGWSAIYDGDVCSWQAFGNGATADCFPLEIDSVNNHGSVLFDGVNGGMEGFISNPMPLIPGREYMVQFDYAVTGPSSWGNTNLDSIVIGLHDNNYTHVVWDPTPAFEHIGSVVDVPVDQLYSSVFDLWNLSYYDPNNYWHHYSFTFIAGPNAASNGRLVFMPHDFSHNTRRDVQFDNISVQPIINVQASAVDTNIYAGSCTDLSGSGSWDEYVWEPSYAVNNQVGNPVTACPDSTTTYIVTAYDQTTGCSHSDSITITVDHTNIGTDEINLGVQVNIHPNPIGDQFTIEAQGFFGNRDLEILDARGKVVYKDELPVDGKITINTTSLSSGVYYCKVAEQVIEIIK